MFAKRLFQETRHAMAGMAYTVTERAARGRRYSLATCHLKGLPYQQRGRTKYYAHDDVQPAYIDARMQYWTRVFMVLEQKYSLPVSAPSTMRNMPGEPRSWRVLVNIDMDLIGRLDDFRFRGSPERTAGRLVREIWFAYLRGWQVVVPGLRLPEDGLPAVYPWMQLPVGSRWSAAAHRQLFSPAYKAALRQLLMCLRKVDYQLYCAFLGGVEAALTAVVYQMTY